MLRFGIVSQINPTLVQARVSFEDDSSTSYWLPILQTKTLKDKYYSMPDIGEQVACLMDENSEDGVILGAIYSTEDTALIKTEKQTAINFEDNSFFNFDKSSHTLTISVKNIKIVGEINQDGNFTSTKDITDKKSSMQSMRDTYNSHTHTGVHGGTSAPHQGM